MKYKEFIQKVVELTNESTVSNTVLNVDDPKFYWAVKNTSDSIKVYNMLDGQPLLTVSKRIYGSMHVYQLPDPIALTIYNDAVLLNKTPKEDRVEGVTGDALKGAKGFLNEVISQLLNWAKDIQDLAKDETRTFYFVGFYLRVSSNALTVDGAHLQGTVSSDRNPNKNFEDNLYDLTNSCQGFKKELINHEDTIKSAMVLLKDQKEDDSLVQFTIDRTNVNSKYLSMSNSRNCLFTWYFEPTYLGSQEKYHDLVGN